MAQIPLTLESLKFADTSRDWCVAAHTLKGSASAVGAWAVAGLAIEAERLEFADHDACSAIVGRIEEAAAEVDAYFATAFPHLSN
jgi:HPt (histidine-containing phosphotransfer) domain-containing protein